MQNYLISGLMAHIRSIGSESSVIAILNKSNQEITNENIEKTRNELLYNAYTNMLTEFGNGEEEALAIQELISNMYPSFKEFLDQKTKKTASLKKRLKVTTEPKVTEKDILRPGSEKRMKEQIEERKREIQAEIDRDNGEDINL